MHDQFLCTNSLSDSSGEKRRCGRQLRAPRDKAGRLAKCPQCGSKVKIPSRSDPQFRSDAQLAASAGAPTFDDPMADADEADSLQLRVARDDFDDPILDGAARPGAIETLSLIHI